MENKANPHSVLTDNSMILTQGDTKLANMCSIPSSSRHVLDDSSSISSHLQGMHLDEDKLLVKPKKSTPLNGIVNGCDTIHSPGEPSRKHVQLEFDNAATNSNKCVIEGIGGIKLKTNETDATSSLSNNLQSNSHNVQVTNNAVAEKPKLQIEFQKNCIETNPVNQNRFSLDSNENKIGVDDRLTNTDLKYTSSDKSSEQTTEPENKSCISHGHAKDLNNFDESTKNSSGEASTVEGKATSEEQVNIQNDAKISSTELIPNDVIGQIEFVQYESELQMPLIMEIIQRKLSEPYSIYTYRYFIHNWPQLCFLAMFGEKCVGAIVCKLDVHRKTTYRGYIAMLAVDENFRKRSIGSTLVKKAIREMWTGGADEVVLETEVTNKPALRLYEALGFVRDKRLFRYYLNGVDALRLKLWLR